MWYIGKKTKAQLTNLWETQENCYVTNIMTDLRKCRYKHIFIQSCHRQQAAKQVMFVHTQALSSHVCAGFTGSIL